MDATDAVRRSAPPLSRSHLLLLLFLSCLLFMDVSSCCSAINLILIYDFFAWFCSANEHFTYVYMLSRPVPVFYSPDDLVFKSGDILSIYHISRFIGPLTMQFISPT
jgi:hypothetical protein